MTETPGRPPLVQTKRELDHALSALKDTGAGAAGNLECRVADLQQRFISTPARTLEDVEARLEMIRRLVLTFGAGGYLHHVVEATLNDVRAMREGAAGRRNR